jgi:adenylate cyclase class 2
MTTSGDGTERELKFGDADLDAVRRRLRRLGAVRTSEPSREDNRIFDRGGELRARGEVLRLREDGRGVRLTWKGPPRFEAEVKVREEREIGVSDATEAAALLERLGFEVVRRYQKEREEWRLGGCDVALDRTPLGDFVELEGEDAAEQARRCGFETAAAERRSYLELWDEHRRQKPDVPPDMLLS